MKPFDELVEEVYSNVSFRGEFAALARLRATLDLSAQQVSAHADASGDGATPGFMGYYEIREATVRETTLKMMTEAPAVKACKRGISLLFSSIYRGLLAQYHLDAEETRRLVMAVAARYM